jgi:hypothetical protein
MPKAKKWFYYLEASTGAPIRFRSYNRPSRYNVPRSGTWKPVQEWDGQAWRMGAYPEITWGVIANSLVYLGSSTWEKPNPYDEADFGKPGTAEQHLLRTKGTGGL